MSKLPRSYRRATSWEEEVRAAPLEGQVAELVDDEQLGLVEEEQAVGDLPVGSAFASAASSAVALVQRTE